MDGEAFNQLNDVSDFLVEIAKNVKAKFVGAGFSDEMAEQVAIEFVKNALARRAVSGTS